MKQRKTDKALYDNESRFRSLVEATSDCIWEVDKNAIYTYVNSKVRDILGYEPEEVIGKRPFDFMPPDEAERVGKLFRDFATSHTPFEKLENINLHKDGRLVVLETSGVPIYDAKGSFLGYRGIDRDITERKRAEDALEESRQQLSDIINFLPDATLVIDVEGKVIAWNRAIEDMTKIRAADMLGKGDYEYVLPFYGERRPILADLVLKPDTDIEKKYVQTERRGPVLVGESYIMQFMGSETYQLGMATTLKDSKGKIVGAIESIRDITDRRKTEEALRLSEEKYRSILENIEEGYYEVDLPGNFTFFNPSMARIIGYPPEEMAGMNNRRFMDDVNADKVFTAFNEVYQTGLTAKCVDVELIRKDLGIVTVEISISGIIDSSGKTIGFRGIVRDITERKRAEEEKERLIVELTDALSQVKALSGLLPICSSCKKIRNDKGSWEQLEVYIRDHSEADFSHSICPDCMKMIYPELFKV